MQRKMTREKENRISKLAFTFRDIPVQLGNQLYSSLILDRKVSEDEIPSEKKLKNPNTQPV